jgi:hypothetical protein
MKTTSLRIISSTLNSFGQRSTRMLWTMIGMLLVATALEIQALGTPPQVVITSVNNQTFFSGSFSGWVYFDLTADVFNFAAPVAKVDYYEGSTLIGTATQAPYDVGLYYQIQTLGLSGTHYIDAVATDTLGNVVRTTPNAFWYNICDFFVYNLDLLPFICQIFSPDPGSVFAYGDPIPIQVSVIEPCDGMFDGIDLYLDSQVQHLNLGGTFVWENASLGLHHIGAIITSPGPIQFSADGIDINVTVNDTEAPVASSAVVKAPVLLQNPLRIVGWFQLLATDNSDPDPLIYLKGNAGSFVAGPFHNGDQVEIAHGRSLIPRQAPSTFGGNIATIQLNGDVLLWAVDSSGNASTPVRCR